MSYLKGGVGAVLAIMAAASMQTASAGIIDSNQAYVSTTGTTHTEIVDGGNVSFFEAYDASSVDMSGGHVSFLTLRDSAAATGLTAPDAGAGSPHPARPGPPASVHTIQAPAPARQHRCSA